MPARKRTTPGHRSMDTMRSEWLERRVRDLEQEWDKEKAENIELRKELARLRSQLAGIATRAAERNSALKE